MATFNNHPVFRSIGDVENQVQNITVSSKHIVIDGNEKFEQGVIEHGYTLNGDLYGESEVATPVDLVYTSTVLFSQRVEAWQFVKLQYAGTIGSLEFRTSKDGNTFSKWNTVTLGDVFEANAPYFQLRITASPTTVIDKIVVGFSEKTPDIAKMLDTLAASVGQANVDFDTHYTYDANGNIVEQRYSGGIEKILRYGYDTQGNVKLVEVEENGTVSRQYFEYDTAGNVTYMGTRNRRAGSSLVDTQQAYQASATDLSDTLLDEIEVSVEVAEDVKATQSFAFDDIEMPERHTAEGKKAWQALNNKIHEKKLDIEVVDKGEHGKLKGKIRVGGEDVATWLVNNGYAKRI